jgi:hypothetical protein
LRKKNYPSDPNDRKGQIQSLNYLVREFQKLIKGGNSFISEFINALKALVNNLNVSPSKSNQDIGKWTIRRTSDPLHLLMSGTDVQGSCQRIDGNPELNSCLLAYMMDGKIQMIAIFNEVDEIVGRAILKVLLDRATNTPILFLEEIYPYTLSSKFRQTIFKFASLCAERLNLTLMGSEVSGDADTYPHPLVSLGSIDEYVDALHGKQEKGIYEISDAKVIYVPKNQSQIMAQLSLCFQQEQAPEEQARAEQVPERIPRVRMLKQVELADVVRQYLEPSVAEHEAALLFGWNASKASQKKPDSGSPRSANRNEV